MGSDEPGNNIISKYKGDTILFEGWLFKQSSFWKEKDIQY